MNEAGNFLIETCDEVVSRDLKQQLLLLNGRWRELFMEVKQVCLSNLCTLRACVCCHVVMSGLLETISLL